jgi:hypothetical protein
MATSPSKIAFAVDRGVAGGAVTSNASPDLSGKFEYQIHRTHPQPPTLAGYFASSSPILFSDCERHCTRLQSGRDNYRGVGIDD